MNRFVSRLFAGVLLAAPLAIVASARPTGPGMLPLSARTTPTATENVTATPTRTPQPSPTPTPTPLPVSASDADNGRTIFVARGGLIELRLASNPSAGEAWTVVSSRNLRLEGEPNFEPAPTPGPTTTPQATAASPTTSLAPPTSPTPGTGLTAGADAVPVPGATPSMISTVGSTGFTVLRFRALRQGRGDLALDLRATDAKIGGAPIRQFRSAVRVLK